MRKICIAPEPELNTAFFTGIKEIQEDDKLELKNRNQYVHSETAFPISSLLPLSFQLSPFSFYYVPHYKSIVAVRDIKEGEEFTEENLTVKRPGTGISPMRWDEVIGRKAGRDYKIDEIINV